MRKTKTQSGFTLIELMVSLSLFTVVILAAVSSLYTVNSAARKVQGMRTVMDNLNFAMESMSRTIRTGSNIVCGGEGSSTPDCPFSSLGTNSKILVTSTFDGNNLVEYQLGTHTNGNGAIQKHVKTSGVWGPWISMTTPEIDVENLKFYVEGSSPSDTTQANVQIMISGVATAASEVSPFAIQMYVSQRAAE